ncbi:GGDEF domain-containing protein [Curvibacter sp. APW13]|uniref:GGDEF domain-containing protein n=1 Tax=Curvibacter sp. APW13 TaxID=3077236 RepID=UPI0028DE8A1C|nr:GGDEF domain-containing protein [Curvibacter sp. APW13]MDT8990912.1 GGDEF domain-containing protein [Curvibacter sp. APW13]
MTSLTEHLIKLTDHRDRDLLELTLAKAMVKLLPIDRVLISKVVSEEGVKRWIDIVTLDARGGGKVQDPLRVDFDQLPKLEDERHRMRCLMEKGVVEYAWAGDNGPRISYLPLFLDNRNQEEGVIEVHSGGSLTQPQLDLIGDLHHVFINMYNLLAYSDRDALTGLLNRKSLDDTFYRAVLDELGELENPDKAMETVVAPGKERRHRVPPNYWLGAISVDDFKALKEQHGQVVAEEVLLLVARIVNNTFRTYDRLYRFGGDEFGVLMHCPDEALVLAAFERFRANIEKFNFPQVGRVTISAGFTRITPDDSPQTSLARAESAVDYAQQHGKNQVFSHPDLLRRGLASEGA